MNYLSAGAQKQVMKTYREVAREELYKGVGIGFVAALFLTWLV